MLTLRSNPGIPDRYRQVGTTLNAAVLGSGATSVLFFDGAGEGNEGQGFELSTDAVNGTIIDVTTPGLYFVTLRVAVTAGAAALGLTKNTDAAGLIGLGWNVVGTFDFNLYEGPDALGNFAGATLGQFIPVTNADIEEGVAAGGLGARFRAHSSVSTLNTGNAAMRITKISELY